MMEVYFTVPWEPQPQGSLNFYGNGRVASSNKKLKPYREAVVAAAQATGAKFNPQDAVKINVTFVLTRPKSVSIKKRKYPTAKPDLDKLQRALGDALTISGLIHDDAQIVRWSAVKVYNDSLDSLMAGAYVSISVEE